MELKPQAALGMLSDWTVPQSWFSHFYMIGSTCNAMLMLLYLRCGTGPVHSTTVASLILIQIHLTRRWIETLFMMTYPVNAEMHGIAYIFGLSYYIALPLTIMLPVVDKWECNCAQHAWHMDISTLAMRPSEWIGVAIFFVGMALQWHSHSLLAQLASNRKGRYSIPRGGAFEFVSCPHYLGEIVLYSGLVVVQQGRLEAWLIWGWVVSNLLLAGGLTHRWYAARFKTYPPQRRAIIPYLY